MGAHLGVLTQWELSNEYQYDRKKKENKQNDFISNVLITYEVSFEVLTQMRMQYV